MDLVIRNAKVVDAHFSGMVDIAIEGGDIGALLSPGTACTAAQELDAQGCIVMPGLIDAHVHLREPGLTHKETIATGTAAAVCGGVTTVLDMPNTAPPVSSPQILKEKGKLVAGQAWADVGFYALLGPGMVHQLAALVEVGCVGFKLFLGPTTGSLPAPDWGELYEAFQILADLGVPVVVHAEDRAWVECGQAQVSNRGVFDYQSFLIQRPKLGEVSATQQICLLAGATGAPIHIAHVTSAEAVEVIGRAKSYGWSVTAETSPMYLFLSDEDYAAVGTAMKVLPPVRGRTDQAALWAALRNGIIDMIATDHAPHTPADKDQDLANAAAGAPGVETLLPLLLDAGRQGRCTLADITRWCAYEPARRFGFPNKGRIQPGGRADLVIIDTNEVWTIDQSQLHSKSCVTPFHGRRGVGKARYAILAGNIVMADGDLVGRPRGNWVKPTQGGRASHAR
ncbi:MAG TPA: dihydroorotase family protein [Firmicutes bacterium]|nr:dihydroorotase family protein [Bacillota bacterium]